MKTRTRDSHPAYQAVTDSALIARPVPDENEGVFAWACESKSYQHPETGKWEFTLTYRLMRCMVVEAHPTEPDEASRYGQAVRLRVYALDALNLDKYEAEVYAANGYLVRNGMGWHLTEDEARRRMSLVASEPAAPFIKIIVV